MTLLYEQPTAEPLTPEQQLEQDIALVLQTALEHHHKGEFSDAEALYLAILEAKPGHADVSYNLGVLCVQTARPADALPHFELALGAAPQNGQYWIAYVSALVDAGETAAAWLALEIGQKQGLKGPAVDGLVARMTNPDVVIQTFPASSAEKQTPRERHETSINPDFVETSRTADRSKSGIAAGRRVSQQDSSRFTTLYNKGRVAEAIKLARTLTQRFPADGFSWRSLGIALHRLGQYDEAIAPLRKASDLISDDLESRIVLADTLRLRGQHAEAEQECRGIIATNPNHSEAHRILGMALVAQGQAQDGLASARRAVELAPNQGTTHSTLGVLLLEQGFMADAEQSFRHALEADPKDAIAHDNFLFALTHNPKIDTQALLAEHIEFAERHEAPVRALWPRHSNNRTPNRQLKIGLVSGDLFQHAVATYLQPVLEHLSLDNGLSLHVYSNHIREDSYTQALRGFVKTWQQITGMPDEQLAEKIRQDRIDVLIDLSGHTGRNRLLTFARKPAPVQASWIGYPGTTGLNAVDYYLADPFLVASEKQEAQFVEKIAYLPAVAPFQPPAACPPVNYLPALHNGYITFGSFNRINKLHPEVIALWAQLLHSVPNARMVVGGLPTGNVQEMIVDWFAAEGIARARLEFLARANTAAYMQQHHRVDICLDTFPYTGATTTLHALWMGVPTLSIEGDTIPSRGGAQLLAHSGLKEFVAGSKEQFLQKGQYWAANFDALAELRSSLRGRCAQSPVFRPEIIAQGLSRALRTMWERWCAGEPPASIDAWSWQQSSE
ncbi:O-linked N-acetylglucosamine transferase family protein [Paraburkholderia aspalathi]|uniref:protein O-GlcNAc transferase n=1 Tax=Paraburkholderia aspalathi TaxID=1324617 RepID=A0A1I7EHS3_9BURK|nr:tetratricopeptide repeat protein [Paraburkholderia aspalathi]SFU23459.1 Predicted O-linked N-acetylglucosamine transferase, SPINDLY family [Paraburkholderia aspalathi]